MLSRPKLFSPNLDNLPVRFTQTNLLPSILLGNMMYPAMDFLIKLYLTKMDSLIKTYLTKFLIGYSR